MTTAAEYACLAGYAEAMNAAGLLAPPIDTRANDWQIVGYITAQNALFNLQRVGVGQRVFFGFHAFRMSDPREHVVVIRGTESAIEWIEDADAILAPGPPIGLVHRGFWSIYQSARYFSHGALGDGLLAAQGITAAMPIGASVTFIGHSLGGPIATYMVHDTARIPFAPRQREFSLGAVLFASPRPGDRAYVENFDEVVGKLNYSCYAYERDRVPHLPVWIPTLPFKSLLGTTWIKPSQSQAIISDTPGCCHAATSYARMLDYASADGTNSCVLGPRPS
jgi:pimeloyl-ACP methyl ester carboxylesterase